MSNKKVLVEVFIPAGACGCSFSHWIDRVYRIIMPYRDEVNSESHTTDSERARELDIRSMCVAVDQKVVNVMKLEQAIKEALVNAA